VLWFNEVVIAGNMFYDLSDFYAAHPDYVAMLHPDMIDFNTHEDGRKLTLPMPIQRPIGMFYNSALWDPSRPIHEMNWMEVAADLGDNRIAFMTGENSWTTVLPLTSMIALQPGGAELLRHYSQADIFITDFNQPALIAAFEQIQYLLMNYAQAGAIGAPYAEAANSFFNLESAIIANGPWMIGDITDGQDAWWGENFNPDTIRGTILPGNVAVGNTFGFGYWVPSTASSEEIELIMAWLSFTLEPEELEWRMIIAGGTIPGFNYSDTFMADLEEHRLMSEWLSAINADTVIVPGLFGAMVPSVANHDFGALVPLLVDGSLTAEQFATELTQRTSEAIIE
jgi:raffinose/stachyose/melibiose transport system substrate-binding protein